MRVQVQDRLDEKTIICKVSWDQPLTKNTMRVHVRVHATLDEFSAENSAEIVSAAIRSRALIEARSMADDFSSLVSEGL